MSAMSNIKSQHSFAVHGFVRQKISLTAQRLMPDPVINLILFYYAKPITLKIRNQKKREYTLQFHPLHDTWSSVMHEINHAFDHCYAATLPLIDVSGNVCKRDEFPFYTRNWNDNDTFVLEAAETHDKEEKLKRLQEDFGHVNTNLTADEEQNANITTLKLMGFKYTNCIEATLVSRFVELDTCNMVEYLLSGYNEKKKIYDKAVALATQQREQSQQNEQVL
eukprot:123717_1